MEAPPSWLEVAYRAGSKGCIYSPLFAPLYFIYQPTARTHHHHQHHHRHRHRHRHLQPCLIPSLFTSRGLSDPATHMSCSTSCRHFLIAVVAPGAPRSFNLKNWPAARRRVRIKQDTFVLTPCHVCSEESAPMNISESVKVGSHAAVSYRQLVSTVECNGREESGNMEFFFVQII